MKSGGDWEVQQGRHETPADLAWMGLLVANFANESECGPCIQQSLPTINGLSLYLEPKGLYITTINVSNSCI
jgi:hypothetical protein